MTDIRTLIDPVTGDEVVDILTYIKPELMKQKILDHGFVNIVDCMPRLIPTNVVGGDFALADAARLSYQKGTRKLNSDSGLVDNLIRQQHTSPIEMGEIKFHIRLPIFVMRQLVRHRTASLNEESARYSELASDFYVPLPEHWAINTSADKQATQQGKFTMDQAQQLYAAVKRHNVMSYELYQALLYDKDTATEPFIAHSFEEDMDKFLSTVANEIPGLAREQARMVLGVNIYTQCIWKMDLKNLLHCMKLRTDKHAQFEIREFADAIARVNEALFPAAWASFKDHFIDGVNFGRSELGLLGCLLGINRQNDQGQSLYETARKVIDLGWTGRRFGEFLDKVKRSGLVSSDALDAAAKAVKANKPQIK